MTSKFRQTGPLKRKFSRLAGRHQTARTPENLRALAETVAESPEKSVRLRLFASGLQISVTSAWRILRKDLGLFPYTISMNHKLTARDCERRQRMSNEFLFRIADDPLWLNNVWFSDESHFYLSGKVNKTHCIFWGTQKPDKVLQAPLH